MLNYKDLRIGNFILANDLLQVVSAISSGRSEEQEEPLIGFFKDQKLIYLSADSEMLQPIPINDDILKRCGFRFDSYFKLWQKMKKVLGTGVDMELSREYSALDFSHRPILKELEHLHQLQNLYYTLKRKELVVNLITNQALSSQEVMVE